MSETWRTIQKAPAIEKRLRSQEELLRIQGGIVREHLEQRLRFGGQFVKDHQDLRSLIRKLENFRESLLEYESLVENW